MASGDFVMMDQHGWIVKLYDVGATTAGNGPWVEVPVWFNVRSFFCDPTDNTNTIGADSVSIEAGNFATAPTASTSGLVVKTGLTGTTLGGTNVETYRWVRAVKTGTAKTVVVILTAARNE